MKKTAFYLSLVSLVTLYSCNLSGDEANPEELDFETELSIQSSFEEIDIITEDGINFSSAGRMDNENLRCATVTKAFAENSVTITIDFGDGCGAPNGRVRSGKIVIQHNGRPYVAGSSRVVTFENFKIDSVLFEGVRTVTNTTSEETPNPQFTSTLTGGKITFTDGSVITREAAHVRTWFREPSPRDDYAAVTGGASGVNRDGQAYEVAIVEQLIFKRICGAEAQIPVSGIKTVTVGDREVTIDYGDGSCNNRVMVTRDGETREREIDVRRPQRPNRRG